MSLRNAIDRFCRQCIVDKYSPGTWKQQVTLCESQNCPLFNVRPKTAANIPESVIRWQSAEKPLVHCSETQGKVA